MSKQNRLSEREKLLYKLLKNTKLTLSNLAVFEAPKLTIPMVDADELKALEMDCERSRLDSETYREIRDCTITRLRETLRARKKPVTSVRFNFSGKHHA